MYDVMPLPQELNGEEEHQATKADYSLQFLMHGHGILIRSF
jgi:hypothetical protein